MNNVYNFVQNFQRDVLTRQSVSISSVILFLKFDKVLK
jgi:hypothetical protein